VARQYTCSALTIRVTRRAFLEYNMDRLIKACFLLAFIALSAMAGAMAVDGERVVIIKSAAGEWERVR
jgi:hypothetical protein